MTGRTLPDLHGGVRTVHHGAVPRPGPLVLAAPDAFKGTAGAPAVARAVAAEHEVPLTVIRIFSTYGPLGGAPADRLQRILAGKEVVLHPDRPNNFNPIYEDDYVRLGIRALEVATDPPVTVNWAGSETVSAEEYCEFLAALVGRQVRFRYEDGAPWPLWPDVTRMHEVLGRTTVPWQEGMRRMVEARHPEVLA